MDEFDDYFGPLDETSIQQLEQQLSQYEQRPKAIAPATAARPPSGPRLSTGTDQSLALQDQLKKIDAEKMQLQLDALAKGGEISIVRSQLSKLETENSSLKLKLDALAYDSNALEKRLKEQHAKEIDKIKTKYLFQINDMSLKGSVPNGSTLSEPSVRVPTISVETMTENNEPAILEPYWNFRKYWHRYCQDMLELVKNDLPCHKEITELLIDLAYTLMQDELNVTRAVQLLLKLWGHAEKEKKAEPASHCVALMESVLSWFKIGPEGKKELIGIAPRPEGDNQHLFEIWRPLCRELRIKPTDCGFGLDFVKLMAEGNGLKTLILLASDASFDVEFLRVTLEVLIEQAYPRLLHLASTDTAYFYAVGTLVQSIVMKPKSLRETYMLTGTLILRILLVQAKCDLEDLFVSVASGSDHSKLEGRIALTLSVLSAMASVRSKRDEWLRLLDSTNVNFLLSKGFPVPAKDLLIWILRDFMADSSHPVLERFVHLATPVIGSIQQNEQ